MSVSLKLGIDIKTSVVEDFIFFSPPQNNNKKKTKKENAIYGNSIMEWKRRNSDCNFAKRFKKKTVKVLQS